MTFILPLNIFIFRRNVEIGHSIVATNNIYQLNRELDLEIELKPFMVDQILGIINESQHVVLVEIFPEKFHKFESEFNFLTPFVYFVYMEDI